MKKIQESRVGTYVEVEVVYGSDLETATRKIFKGEAYRDEEGTLRVGNANLTRDADGYFCTACLLRSDARTRPVTV